MANVLAAGAEARRRGIDDTVVAAMESLLRWFFLVVHCSFKHRAFRDEREIRLVHIVPKATDPGETNPSGRQIRKLPLAEGASRDFLHSFWLGPCSQTEPGEVEAKLSAIGYRCEVKKSDAPFIERDPQRPCRRPPGSPG